MAVGRAGRSTRAARLSFLALLLYVVADFANPLMPGAVCFDPDDSIDGVARARSSPVEPPALACPAAPAQPALALPRPVTAPRSMPPSDTPAVAAVPRARAALPLVSDRASDDV